MSIDRRTFTKSAATLGGLAAVRVATGATVGSNERIRIGLIGAGNRGDQLLEDFLPHKDCEIAAICDVYEPYLQAAVKKCGGHARTFRDYRKLLDQKDIDAVVIATPDHWHALQMIDACRAGKDVYVEKPASLTIAEGRKMVDVAAETRRVVQVGLQRRSMPYIQDAVERIHRGEIGRVTLARCYTLRNEFPLGLGKTADSDPPAGLDWDMWLGPAPKAAYNANRCFYKFRWFWNYSGGQVTNMATHYMDVIQWALGQNAPQSVFAAGGKLVMDDDRETPDTMEVIWQYAPGTLVTFSQHNGNDSAGNPRNWDMEFQGTLGTLGINNRGYEIVPQKVREQILPTISPLARAENAKQGSATRLAGRAVSVPATGSPGPHARNFLDCVRTRATPCCSIATGHQSTTATLLANIALRVGRPVHWNAKEEQIVGDADASKLLSYEYRAPWRLS